MRRVDLLGLEFADMWPQTAADWVLARPPEAAFDYVVTPNADHLVRLSRDRRLAGMYRDAALCLLDSRVVARTAWAIGLPVPRVVTGSDLTARVLAALTPDDDVTLIGLSPAWLPALRARTGLAPAHLNPPMGFARDPAALSFAVRFVVEHPARIILLAVGSPGQELLASAIKAGGAARGIGLCVGASIEFLVGAAPRAPSWMQTAGIEWLQRLAHDPRRLVRRYLRDDLAIFPLLLRERRSRRRAAWAPD